MYLLDKSNKEKSKSTKMNGEEDKKMVDFEIKRTHEILKDEEGTYVDVTKVEKFENGHGKPVTRTITERLAAEDVIKTLEEEIPKTLSDYDKSVSELKEKLAKFEEITDTDTYKEFKKHIEMFHMEGHKKKIEQELVEKTKDLDDILDWKASFIKIKEELEHGN